jgi:hypothetical protein
MLLNAYALGFSSPLNNWRARDVEAKNDCTSLMGIIEIALSDGPHAIIDDINSIDTLDQLVSLLEKSL